MITVALIQAVDFLYHIKYFERMGKEGQQENLNKEQGIKVSLENDDIASMVWWCNGGMVEW